MPRLPEDPPAVKRFFDAKTGAFTKPLIPLLVDRLELRDALGNCARQAVKTRRMLASDAELAKLGVTDMTIGVDLVNEGALRFYERRGYRADFHVFYGSPGKKPWACLAREEELNRGTSKTTGKDAAAGET
jgi:hypothetical protein